MSRRPIRILLGKMGEGHKEVLLNLAKSFREAGYEVVYTELQEPEAIVRSAIQESVDHIGITTLQGAKIEAFVKMMSLLRTEKVDHITVTAGGHMEEGDIPRLKQIGIKEFFPKGTTFEELILWSRQNIKVEDS